MTVEIHIEDNESRQASSGNRCARHTKTMSGGMGGGKKRDEGGGEFKRGGWRRNREQDAEIVGLQNRDRNRKKVAAVPKRTSPWPLKKGTETKKQRGGGGGEKEDDAKMLSMFEFGHWLSWDLQISLR